MIWQEPKNSEIRTGSQSIPMPEIMQLVDQQERRDWDLLQTRGRYAKLNASIEDFIDCQQMRKALPLKSAHKGTAT